MINIRKTM